MTRADMAAPRRPAERRHPAILGALLHGGLSLLLAVGVAIAVAAVPAGAPRSLAPILLAAYIVVTVAVMSTGIFAAMRARSRRAAHQEF